ncbi:adenylyltransferase/cytidyltransferase family protein, partial [bacterium]|nr:adenylyltransferase/cytidyltransferase family protein [bacterium]
MSPKILLFGGTFDPLHNGHLAILNQTQKHQSFHKIIIIPSYTPPLKNQSLAS